MSKIKEIITPIDYAEVVPAQQLEGVDYDRRMGFAKLLARTAGAEALPADYASPTDLALARPESLQAGLYVLRDDPRYSDAQLRVQDTIFPSQEFGFIARSPADLARHSKATTRKANAGNPDRDDAGLKIQRSAGHALETKIEATDALLLAWQERRRLLASLAIDLGGTYPHYKGRNLELRRVEIDQAIHQTAEVAAVNRPDWNNKIVEGVHRAIKVHLYRTDTTVEARIFRWVSYMKLVDRHTRAKSQIATEAQKFTVREFQKYKPYLEDALF